MAENSEQLGKADNKGSYSESKKFVATISSKSYILLLFLHIYVYTSIWTPRLMT